MTIEEIEEAEQWVTGCTKDLVTEVKRLHGVLEKDILSACQDCLDLGMNAAGVVLAVEKVVEAALGATPDRKGGESVTLGEFLSMIESAEEILDDRMLSVELMSDGSGHVEINGKASIFDNLAECFEILLDEKTER